MSNEKAQTPAKPADDKSAKPADVKPSVPVQPTDKPAENTPAVEKVEIKPLESFDETLAGAVRMLNTMSKTHNDAVKYLRSKSGDKDEAIKVISESDDVAEIITKRERKAQLLEAIKRVDDEIADLAEHEYANNAKYAPLTPELIAAKQEEISDVRKKWQNGFNGLEILAMMSGTTDADLAYIRENHTNALEKAGRKSHAASTTGGETTIMRKRIRNIRLVNDGVEKPISEDIDNHTFGKLSAKFKDFSVKVSVAELTAAAIAAYDKGNGWDDVPEVNAVFVVSPKGGTQYVVKFDKQ